MYCRGLNNLNGGSSKGFLKRGSIRITIRGIMGGFSVGALIIRIGVLADLHYMIIIRSPQNPILVINAPTLGWWL